MANAIRKASAPIITESALKRPESLRKTNELVPRFLNFLFLSSKGTMLLAKPIWKNIMPKAQVRIEKNIG